MTTTELLAPSEDEAGYDDDASQGGGLASPYAFVWRKSGMTHERGGRLLTR
jgi:hypothetical protein